MKTLKDFNFEQKKVLVRCDFNVSVDETGKITEDMRIIKALPTIKHLIDQGGKTVLMSHLEKNGKLISLKVVAERLEKLLQTKVRLLNDCVGPLVSLEISRMKGKEVVLLENLRFHKGEKENDEKFAQQIAQMGDFYVNEAFSCCHRAHASITGIPKFLPSCAGFLLQEEIENLSNVLTDPAKPFVVIVGGAKVEAKIKTILNISKKADHILFGSKIGEAILIQKQMLLGRGFPSKEKLIEEIDLTSPKIHMPVDGVMALKNLDEGYLRKGAIGTVRSEEEIYDIGPETIKFFKEIVRQAKTIFFSGPLGMFENTEFTIGTKEILDAIAKNHTAFKVAGGGETLEAINKFNVAESFDFLSTGGGAMLEFLAGTKLPGIEALQ